MKIEGAGHGREGDRYGEGASFPDRIPYDYLQAFVFA
jgi:hypothetical protein